MKPDTPIPCDVCTEAPAIGSCLSCGTNVCPAHALEDIVGGIYCKECAAIIVHAHAKTAEALRWHKSRDNTDSIDRCRHCGRVVHLYLWSNHAPDCPGYDHGQHLQRVIDGGGA